MTNIVEQARAVQHPACRPLVNELANEIERLRVVLRSIRSDCKGFDCDGCRNAIELARRALEPKS
jgi:hypothetical protein